MPKSKIRKKGPPATSAAAAGAWMNWKVIAAVAVAAVGAWLVLARSSSGVDVAEFSTLVDAGRPALALVVTEPDLGNNHVRAGTSLTYRSDPPTSGTHWDIWVEPGFYDSAQPLGALVHAMEHGHIVIFYGEVGEDGLATIRDWVQTWRGNWDGVVAVPRPDLGTGVDLAAWTRFLRLPEFDAAAAAAFVDRYRGRGPENPVR